MKRNPSFDNRYFVLFACCVPVTGARRSILCDLQRQNFIKIPTALYFILEKYEGKTIGWIIKQFDKSYETLIYDYFTQLADKEYGFFTDSYSDFPKLKLEQNNELKIISNAIIDFDKDSKHNIHNIVAQLNYFFCEGLEVRLYSKRSKKFIENIIQATENSSLRFLQLSIKYDELLSEDSLKDFQKKCPRLKIIVVHGSNENRVLESQEGLIYFSIDNIHSETCCGQISPFYFSINIKSYIEAKTSNSCLSNKISVDKNGEIKNCPSMSKSFGNIKNISLKTVVDMEEFKSIWSIKKDLVEICSDCEYRYICQDCRAYTTNSSNPYSKPAKCNYDPYAR